MFDDLTAVFPDEPFDLELLGHGDGGLEEPSPRPTSPTG